MKSLHLLLFFLLITYNLLAQKIYQSAEVETPAEPNGGIVLLNKFIAANLQVPISIRLGRGNSTVVVSGVVETDGSFTEIKVTQSENELTDLEAIRVVQLYKAWKPAIFKGEKVRQAADVVVVFNVDNSKGTELEEHQIVEYFDKEWKFTNVKANQEVKVITPVDDLGYTNGAVLYYKKDGGQWVVKSKFDFTVEEIWYETSESGKLDSVKVVRKILENRKVDLNLSTTVRQMDGRLLSHYQNTSSGKLLLKKDFYLNGSAESISSFTDAFESKTNWYPNGQVKSVIYYPRKKYDGPEKIMIREFWDENGMQQIVEGNGKGKLVFEKYKGEPVIEEGEVKFGEKTGVWTGKLENGTLLFEENFEKGELINGVSYMDKEIATYTKRSINAEFDGGISELYNFIGERMIYPKIASLLGLEGKVLISFVVCQDGTLCDYKVTKSVHESLDEEALRLVKQMNGKWKPGWQRGNKVRIKYNLPIRFQLE